MSTYQSALPSCEGLYFLFHVGEGKLAEAPDEEHAQSYEVVLEGPAQNGGISIDGIMVCTIFHSCYPMMSLRTSSCPAMTCLDVGFLLQQ